MRKSESAPAALGSGKWIAGILSKSREDANKPKHGGNTSQETKISDLFKKTKADLLSRFTPKMKRKSWSKLTESHPFTHKNGTIVQEKENRSSWSMIFDTKSGKKLHKRAKSDPTDKGIRHLEVLDEMPELAASPLKVKITNVGSAKQKTAYELFEESGPLESQARSVIPSANDEDNDSASDTGTVIIRRPAYYSLDDLYELDEEYDTDIASNEATKEEEAATIQIDNAILEEEVDRAERETVISDDESAIVEDATVITMERYESADIVERVVTNNSEGEHVEKSDETIPGDDIVEASPAQLDGANTDSKSATDESLDDTGAPLDITETAETNTLAGRALAKRVWGLAQSSLILPGVRRLQRKKRLPSCTSSRYSRPWQVTDSVLKTYTAMRGPYRLAGRDLFVWMDRCRKSFPKPEGYDHDVGSCNTVIAGLEPLSLDPPPVQDEPTDKEFFIVPRPPYEHIKAHKGIGRADYAESLTEAAPKVAPGLSSKDEVDDDQVSIEDDPLIYHKTRPATRAEYLESQKNEFYVSDNEGTPSDGRISPCTFRLWAEGCERWDSARVDPSGLKEAYRLHLEALGRLEKEFVEGEAAPAADDEAPALEDDEAKSHPSSLSYDLGPYPDYVPPRRIVEWQRELQAHMEDAATLEEEGHAAGDHYVADENEINDALQADDARTVAGVDPREAGNVLRHHYSIIRRCDVAEEKACNGIVSARERIDARAAQLERVTADVKAIMNKKNRRNSERRRRAIYRHVSQHLRQVQERSTARHDETFQAALKLAELLKREKTLVDQLTEEAERIGLEGMTPDDIERAVRRMLNGESLEEVKEPENLDEIFF
ncbi:hypothetical protein ACJ41O_002309 [Fusarium nematophilum]